jgi:hypothetical protein
MIANPAPRPKRLWAITIVNTSAALLGLAALAALLLAGFRAGAVPIAYLDAALSAFIPAFLIVGSILALLGYPRGRWIALCSAVLFFGLRLTQSLMLLTHYDAAQSPFTAKDLRDGVLYNILGLALNVWAFLSGKTDDYFADKQGGA